MPNNVQIVQQRLGLLAVTGSSGNLGRAVVAAFDQHSPASQMIALGRSSGPAGWNFRKWDTGDTFEDMVQKLACVKTVCHMAAYIPRNQMDPNEAEPCFQINALGTLTLARAAIQAGVKRFIFISSANIITNLSGSIVETDPPDLCFKQAPYYLASKVLAESYLLSLTAQADMSVHIIRPSSIYTPGAQFGILHKIVTDLKYKGQVQLTNGHIYGSDFVHVKDVANVIVQSAASDIDGIMNVGSGVRTTLLDIAMEAASLLGVDPQGIHNENTDDGAARLGFNALDITKAEQYFGYVPYTMTQALTEIIKLDAAGHRFT
jgi:UDP-glucose 4-epimerase